MTGRADYQARRERRIERLQERAQKATEEAKREHDVAHQMAEVIPLGQPILMGHHSEGTDRRYRGRISNHFTKSAELQDQAAELLARAEAAAKNDAISSDDPDAIEKLEAKYRALQNWHAAMKKANTFVKKGDRAGLLAMGFTEKRVDELLNGDICGRKGFPTYALTNNSANMKRVRERIEHLKKHANDVTQEWTFGNVRVVDNVEDNRVQIFYPGKPSESVRAKLKMYGFKWAPSADAWQRLRNESALFWAKKVAKETASA